MVGRPAVRNRRLLVILAVVVTAASLAAVALGGSFNYFNGTLAANDKGSTAGAATRQYNKVWRPIGISFGLNYYFASLGGQAWVHNSSQNPFTDTRSAVSDHAQCWNSSIFESNPTTCQTTVP